MTAFFIVLLVLHLLFGLYFLLEGATLQLLFTSLPGWAPAVIGVLDLAAAGFVLGAWKFRRWGVYGYAIAALLASLITLIVFPAVFAIPGAFGLILFVLLMRSRRSYIA